MFAVCILCSPSCSRDPPAYQWRSLQAQGLACQALLCSCQRNTRRAAGLDVAAPWPAPAGTWCPLRMPGRGRSQPPQSRTTRLQRQMLRSRTASTSGGSRRCRMPRPLGGGTTPGARTWMMNGPCQGVATRLRVQLGPVIARGTPPQAQTATGICPRASRWPPASPWPATLGVPRLWSLPQRTVRETVLRQTYVGFVQGALAASHQSKIRGLHMACRGHLLAGTQL